MARPRKLVSVVKPPKRPYQLRYRDPITRKQIRTSAGTHDEAEARKQAELLEAKLILKAPIDRAQPLTVIGPQMSWDEFRKQYRIRKTNYMRKSGKDDAESGLNIATRIVNPATLADMTKRETVAHLRDALLAGAESRYDRPRSPATVNSILRVVFAGLNWAREQGWVDVVPPRPTVKEQKDQPMRGRPLTQEEVNIFLAAAKVRVGKECWPSWRFVIDGMLASGLRLAEVMAMSWDDSTLIRPDWSGEFPVLHIPATHQKNGKAQTIPLCPWFDGLLGTVPLDERTGYVFNPKSLDIRYGRKVRVDRPSADRVGRVLSEIGEAAKIIVEPAKPSGEPEKYASAHDLRRTFADRLIESNLDRQMVRLLLRHADIRTTERYYLKANTQRDAAAITDALAGSKLTRAKPR